VRNLTRDNYTQFLKFGPNLVNKMKKLRSEPQGRLRMRSPYTTRARRHLFRELISLFTSIYATRFHAERSDRFSIPVRFSRTFLMSYAIARTGVAKVNTPGRRSRTNDRTITLKAKEEPAGRSSVQLYNATLASLHNSSRRVSHRYHRTEYFAKTP
jgi:hypothetical protein